MFNLKYIVLCLLAVNMIFQPNPLKILNNFLFIIFLTCVFNFLNSSIIYYEFFLGSLLLLIYLNTSFLSNQIIVYNIILNILHFFILNLMKLSKYYFLIVWQLYLTINFLFFTNFLPPIFNYLLTFMFFFDIAFNVYLNLCFFSSFILIMYFFVKFSCSDLKKIFIQSKQTIVYLSKIFVAIATLLIAFFFSLRLAIFLYLSFLVKEFHIIFFKNENHIDVTFLKCVSEEEYKLQTVLCTQKALAELQLFVKENPHVSSLVNSKERYLSRMFTVQIYLFFIVIFCNRLEKFESNVQEHVSLEECNKHQEYIDTHRYFDTDED